MEQHILSAENLQLGYDGRVIVDSMEAVIPDGKISIIIGANGCGKSTLLKLILGQVTPDTGSVELGETIRIGYFSQDNSHMEENIRAIDYVREAGDYVDTGEGKISAAMLMERFLFDGNMQWTPVGKLSGGERRRLYLLRVLMGAPNVLILDEPMNSLDKQGVEEVRGILMGLRDLGKTIILASHNKEDIEILCDEVYEMDQGRLEKQER